MAKPPYDFEKAKLLRTGSGLTQEKLAENLKKDRVTIARFETGVTNSMDLLIEYTEYFNKDYRDYLLPAAKKPEKNFSPAL